MAGCNTRPPPSRFPAGRKCGAVRSEASDTVNTVPEATLLAFADHGQVSNAMAAGGGDCERVPESFARAGMDAGELAEQLQQEGADAFVQSGNDLMTCIESKAQAGSPEREIAPLIRTWSGPAEILVVIGHQYRSSCSESRCGELSRPPMGSRGPMACGAMVSYFPANSPSTRQYRRATQSSRCRALICAAAFSPIALAASRIDASRII